MCDLESRAGIGRRGCGPKRVGWAAGMVAFLIPFALVQAATLTVPGSSPTIQGAIDLASAGDIILVSPGTYSEAIVFFGKNVTVRSAGGPNVTTITPPLPSTKPAVQFVNGETRNAVLDGFTLTGGRPSFDPPFWGDGGGIYISGASPTIVNNIITVNVACNGGGIKVDFGSALVSDNVITGNKADCSQLQFSGLFSGGGVSLQGSGNSVVAGNTISGNTADSGSAIGMFAAGAPVIIGNTMTGNNAVEGDCRFDGGTVWMVNQSDADIVQNVIAENEAVCNGGVVFLVPSGARGPALINNTIALNGGAASSGILAEGFDTQTRVVNNLVLARPGTTALACTSIYATTPPLLRNNLFFSSGGTAASELCASEIGIHGNLSADPALVSASTGDYHLTGASPAIDAGLNSETLVPATDFDGVPRVQDGNSDGTARVDMGAFEAPGAVPSPPVLAGAFIRKSHGSAGIFDLPLSLVATAPTTDPRTGPFHTIVLTFNKPIAFADNPTMTEGTATFITMTITANDVVLDYMGVLDAQYLTVNLANVGSTDGGRGSGSLRVGFLLGDANQNRQVTVADVGIVNASLLAPVTAANFMLDVNIDGKLTVADKGITNASLLRKLPPP